MSQSTLASRGWLNTLPLEPGYVTGLGPFCGSYSQQRHWAWLAPRLCTFVAVVSCPVDDNSKGHCLATVPLCSSPKSRNLGCSTCPTRLFGLPRHVLSEVYETRMAVTRPPAATRCRTPDLVANIRRLEERRLLVPLLRRSHGCWRACTCRDTGPVLQLPAGLV